VSEASTLDTTGRASTDQHRGDTVHGDPEIIEFLNEALTAELTAINQYFIHSKMNENWGYQRLAKVYYDESIDEMKDAEKLIERILYLDGVPNLQRYGTVAVGESVTEQLQVDEQTEIAAIERYNRGIALAVAKGDNGTRELLEHRLVGEEHHLDWIEAQLKVISDIGVENYLAQQLHGDDD
jgi:bacterioferritin